MSDFIRTKRNFISEKKNNNFITKETNNISITYFNFAMINFFFYIKL